MTNAQLICALAVSLADRPSEVAADLTMALLAVVITAPRHPGITHEQIRETLHKSIDPAFDAMIKEREATK